MPSKKPAAPKKPAVKTPAKPNAKQASATRAVSSATRTTGTSSARTRKAAAPAITPMSHHDIAARAHDLYVQSGFQDHREVEFWLEAERQLRKGIKL